MPAFSGLILCGGQSLRMGRDKALLSVDGERLIDRAYARLSAVADPVFFAPGTVGRLGRLPGPEVADVRPDSGPLAAIAAGLRVSPTALMAVVAVDMPWSSPELLTTAAHRRSREDAVVPVDAHGPQGLHAIYAIAAAAQIERLLEEGTRSVRRALEQLDCLYIDARELEPSGRFATNVNTEEDLAALGLAR